MRISEYILSLSDGDMCDLILCYPCTGLFVQHTTVNSVPFFN